MDKYTIKFQIEGNVNFPHIALNTLEDLLKVAVFPVMGVELVPLTIEIKKARK